MEPHRSRAVDALDEDRMPVLGKAKVGGQSGGPSHLVDYQAAHLGEGLSARAEVSEPDERRA